MIDRIRALAEEVHDDLVALRRDLHRRPELAFEEQETAARVVEELEALPVEIESGVAETGVIAHLEGGKPGPVLALRADMDALPIQEENEVAYASECEGVMHACGHDVHTSSLVGTARILSAIREQLPGSVRLIFQPSEERLPGGASVMIDEGVLSTRGGHRAPESIFGQHVMPELPAGQIGVRSGSYMASADEIHVTVRGEGGHGASPHELRADAVVVASQIVVALQNVISRACPPGVPSVLTIGRLEAGGSTNVIPATARLEGTFRAMDEEWRYRAHELIRRTVRHTAEAHGAECEIEIPVGYPALHNDAERSTLVRKAAREYVGVDRTVEVDRWYASEDFAFYLQEIPGVFYRLGVGNEELGIDQPVHTSRFDVDERALETGAGFMAYLAWRYAQAHTES